jgi:nucleoside-diphosphate-sugar epimerase
VIEVYGTGSEVREFIYVKDAARGMMAALARGEHREVYNLGTNGRTRVTIRELLEMIRGALFLEGYEVMGKPIEFSNKYDPGDNQRRSICDKIEDLGWQAQVGMSEGVKKTVRWYLETTALR